MPRRFIALLLAAAFVCACSSTSGGDKDSGTEGYAESGNPLVAARLQARVDNIKYQRGMTLIANLERIANYGEVAMPVCYEGLKSEDAMTRMGCAWVLGRIGDTRAVPNLEALLGDEVDFVRYEAASQLGTLGARSGYSVLVDGLAHERVEYRYKCFEALKELTGQDFGYGHNASPEARNAAVKRWQEWLAGLESEEL